MQSDLFNFPKAQSGLFGSESTRVKVLGDPHLGRAFVNGVPLARRGDREKLQWADFEKSLFDTDGAQVHVCMGDLFDRWAVPYEVIFRCAYTYINAAKKNPGVRYIVLQGNHDASKDLTKVSAFQIFAAIVGEWITVVRNEPLRLRDVGLTFIPWDPLLNAAEMVEQHQEMIAGSVAVFGHWDVVAIGDTSNLLPSELLIKDCNVSTVVTGHDHTKRVLQYEGRPVIVTGSMQPYSFAEDVNEQLYVTRTLVEVQADPTVYQWMNLRIMMQPGDVLTDTIDCLQLKLVYSEKDEDEQSEIGQVEFEVFRFDDLFAKALADNGVEPDFADLAKQRWDSERLKE